MNDKLAFYLKDFVWSDIKPSRELIEGVQKQLDFALPESYIDLMQEFNGGEGSIGENSWLSLFPFDELITVNKSYHILMDEIPDYFLFGKDAADTGYAFHKKAGTIHSFGLMSNFERDEIEFCGSDFLGFIEYLYNS